MKMEVELKSEWLVNQIELMKTLHGYKRERINDDIGSIDYIASTDDHGEKLLRVIIDPQSNVSKADMETARKILESLEKEDYDEAIIMAEEFTEASKRLLRENKINYISPDKKPRYSIFELMDAIQMVTYELCSGKCGKVPTSSSDCNGYQDHKYTCPVRSISDNADFHAERGWLWLLEKDFSQLVKLREEMKARGDEEIREY